MTVTELFPEAKVSGPSAVAEIQYTIATSDRPIAKRFTAVAGKPSKLSGDVPLYSGSATTSFLVGDASTMAAQLADTLEGLDDSQVLICAPPPEGQVTWRLVVDDKVEDTPGSISRTKKYFKAAAGHGLLPLDFDTKEFPEDIRTKLAGLTLRDPLQAIFPAFATAADVSRPSMSSGIRHKETGNATPPQGGLHRYFFAKDAQDVPRFARVLKDRLVLNGWGWAQVTAAGNTLIKTLIDFNATTDQSRVWYEGPALLESKLLEFVPDGRKPVVKAGGFLDTSSLQDLTPAERQELDRIETALRAEKADEAERTRLEHKQLMRGRNPHLAPTDFAAFDDDHDQAVEHYVLQGDYPVYLDDGRLVTAREISQSPSRYAGQKCPDPLEREYGAGRNVAIILNGGGDTRIESQAHGGQTFYIRMKVSDVYEDIKDEPAKEQPARIIVPTPFVWQEPSTIPPREWLYDGHYIRQYVSATVAPGGLGKSNLTSVEAIIMATGRPLLGVQPHGRYRVWLWNGEDPRVEVQRRLQAAMMHYEIDRSELEGWLLLDSGRSVPITIAKQTKDGSTIHHPDVDALKAAVRQMGIDCLVIDPFVSAHQITENDNMAIDAVVKTFARLADELNISIELVHHARKLNGREASAEDSRGGSSFVDAARSVRTLVRPSPKEMKSLGLPGDPRNYFRFGDLGKENLTAPATKHTKWMYLLSQPLGNGTPQYPKGDSMGVTTQFAASAGASTEMASDETEAILELLRVDQYRDDPRATDWAGIAVAKVLALEIKNPDDRDTVVQTLRELKAARLITTVMRPDEKRRPRSFIEVCKQ